MLLLDQVTKPKERPILFQGEMVRAILAGTKTQTRRLVKPPPPEGLQHLWTLPRPNAPASIAYWNRTRADGVVEKEHSAFLPYGQPGDQLWVRETWGCHWMYDDVPPRECRSSHPNDNYWYRADPPGTAGTHGCPFEGYMQRWRPAIHMPRWVCRILLEITEVRVERLQSVSEADAEAEGISSFVSDYIRENAATTTAVGVYRLLWDSINGAKFGARWTDNPWVWAVSFRRVTA